ALARREEVFAEVHRHLFVPAAARLRERDHEVGSRLGHEAGTLEEPLDTLSRVSRWRRHVDSQSSSLVEATLEKVRLLEHPEQDGSVTVRDGRGELLRVDEWTAIAQGPVDGAKLGRRRHVRNREPPESSSIARAREEQRLARRAVTSRPPDHLDVALER